MCYEITDRIIEKNNSQNLYLQYFISSICSYVLSRLSRSIIFFNNKLIINLANMSSTQEIEPTPKTPLNKKQLLADTIAFFSIISSYFFISLTLHYNIFESQFGLALNSYSTIVVLYLSYALLIIILKAISTVLSFIKKVQQENDLSSWINSEVSFSLLNILVIISVYIFVHISSRAVLVQDSLKAFTVQQFCHLALWLWISEVLRIFGCFLGRLTGITTLDYFGKSIGVILLVGGLIQPIDKGIFVIF